MRNAIRAFFVFTIRAITTWFIRISYNKVADEQQMLLWRTNSSYQEFISTIFLPAEGFGTTRDRKVSEKTSSNMTHDKLSKLTKGIQKVSDTFHCMKYM